MYTIPKVFSRPRRLFFEGNSLFNLKSATTVTTADINGQYVPSTIYTNFLSNNITYTSFAVGSRTGTMIKDEASTLIMTMISKRDIIIYWEGTNDMGLNGLTAAQAWANVVTYINLVNSYNPVLIICTVIARDKSGDLAGLMDTEIPAYNTLVRNNAATYGYTVCDLAANTLFDARADASNVTYYQADKLHLVPAGSDQIISLIGTTLTPLI